MEEAKLNEFLKDLSISSTYTLLECGKDDNELKDVCEKRGIVFPNPDLAMMKMVYAYTNRTNLNGCRLPEDEVIKALPTVAGKAIDLNHVREKIVGFMVDAKLVGDEIIAYGAFFKSSLGDDFDVIKELFDNKNLAVSFEAWGQREFNEDKTSYNLKDIIFCGLGLLVNTLPAFPGAGVVEMANKRVLEFANIKDKTNFVKSGEKEVIMKAEEMKTKQLESARLWTWDMETISRMKNEIVCPVCKAEGCVDVDLIDFENNKIGCTCWMCGVSLGVDLTPKAKMVVKDKASREIKEVKQITKTEEKSMSKTTNASAEALMKTEDDSSSETNETSTETQVIPSATVDSEGKTVEQIIAETKTKVKQEVTPKATVTLTVDASAVQAELAKLKEEIAKIKNDARAEGKVIGERRSMLGEFAKDMSDDDVLDSVKYENATLRKKLAEVEASKTVVVNENANITTTVKSDVKLEAGSSETKKESSTDVLARNVRKLAWSV